MIDVNASLGNVRGSKCPVRQIKRSGNLLMGRSVFGEAGEPEGLCGVGQGFAKSTNSEVFMRQPVETEGRICATLR